MTVLVSDTSIWTMDDKFGPLVTCNISRCIYCLPLRVMYGGRPLVASALNGPTVLMRNNMLIFSGHDGTPTNRVMEVPARQLGCQWPPAVAQYVAQTDNRKTKPIQPVAGLKSASVVWLDNNVSEHVRRCNSRAICAFELDWMWG
ncbi:hypothetical protein RC84_09110 [Pectobacterium carotovorum subsp. carotovorum]|nr:hypothetical protein RC84_09110 [Pectobacterium carotovorum subsp. carotovorum]